MIIIFLISLLNATIGKTISCNDATAGGINVDGDIIFIFIKIDQQLEKL